MSSRRYKRGQCRQQTSLLPMSLEDYVDEENHVRAIDAYVNGLNLAKLGFQHASGNRRAGQPAYDPGDLLKLYIYGYTHKVRSSRALESEVRRNLEVIWLIGHLSPSYKTIADFRKHNAKALQRANREFALLCRELALFGGQTVGIDGSFFQGNASKSSIYTRTRLKKQVEALERDIAAWHEQLEHNDREDAPPSDTPTTDDQALTTKLEAMKAKLATTQAQLQTLEDSGETQLSTTDPDARLLRKGGQSLSGYNVQIAVDERHKLIAASEVTNAGNDNHQLAPMAEQAKDTMDVEELTALADSGYYENDQFKQCELRGVTAFVGIPDRTQRFEKAGRFSRHAFIYDPERDAYHCPQGQVLPRTGGLSVINGKSFRRYRSSRRQCADCPLRAQCLTVTGTYREIYRWVDEHVVERHRERMENDGPAMMRRRGALAEHPFGTLKRRAGWDHFLVRGFEKVRGEWSLMALCYNFSRVINILGMEQVIAYCQQKNAASGAA